MSIYRRTDRVPLNDLAVTAEIRPSSVPPRVDQDWTDRRASDPANALLKPTIVWASRLPPQAQPKALMAQYPRIANLIAVMWQDPNSLRRYLDDLLVDKRGNRQGFSADILRDIFELRAYFDELHTETSRPWEVMNNDE